MSNLSMFYVTCGVYFIADYNVNSNIITSVHSKILCVDSLENCKLCHKTFITIKMITNLKKSK